VGLFEWMTRFSGGVEGRIVSEAGAVEEAVAGRIEKSTDVSLGGAA